MIRSTTPFSALALPFLAAFLAPLFGACATPEAADEPISAQVSTEVAADADADTVELDPNDPNVVQCPVTGALQLIDPDADGSAHGEAMESGDHHGETPDQD